MSEKTRKMLVFLSLPIAIAWGAWNFMGKPGQAPEGSIPATIQPLSGSTDPQRNGIDEASAEINADSPWGRDPFAGVAKATGGTIAVPTYWNLSGIVYSKTDPMAIINNRAVRVGDEVDGAVVRQIRKSDVQIDYKGSSVTLFVKHG